MASNKAYPNRTDLQNPAQKIARQAAPGQTYGEAGQQLAAQAAVPMGASPVDNIPNVAPGQFGDLNRPTERPAEPISAGAPFGPGPGPEAAGPGQNRILQPDLGYQPGSRQDLIDQVRHVYSKYPNTALFQLMLELENQSLQ